MTERTRWKIVAADKAPKGPYEQLESTAQALEVTYRGAPELKVRINGAPVTFALDINSGTVLCVIVTIGLEGPISTNGLKIKIRRETPVDREGKQRGINQEVQVGDETFDELVYIDSDASDAETRRILARPESRTAALALLRGSCDSIEIRSDVVTATWKTTAIFAHSRLLEALGPLMQLTSAGGPRAKGPGRRGTWLSPVSVLLAGVSVVTAISRLSGWNRNWALAIFGALAGMGVSLALRPAVIRLTAGDSGSFARYRLSVVAQSIALSLFGASLAVHLNARLDRSAPVFSWGTVVAVGTYDDDDNDTLVEISWENGARSSHVVHGYHSVGEAMQQAHSRGAFGFDWGTWPDLPRPDVSP